jgi:hypothetical protein
VILVPALAALGLAVPNACTLLTNAEAATVLGSKIESHEPGGGGHSCTWTGVNLSRPGFYETHRTLMVDAAAESRAGFVRSADREASARLVRGLGDVAFRTGNGNITFLAVWQKGYVVTLEAGLVTDPLAAEKQAAKLALKRLTG